MLPSGGVVESGEVPWSAGMVSASRVGNVGRGGLVPGWIERPGRALLSLDYGPGSRKLSARWKRRDLDDVGVRRKPRDGRTDRQALALGTRRGLRFYEGAH